MLSLQGWGLIDLPLRATFLPAQPRRVETREFPGRGPSGFPHFALRGAARLSFTARIEGAHSDCAASASKKDGLAAPRPIFQHSAMPLIWCAISGHGYGHAAQVVPVLNALGALVPGLTAVLRTTVPSSFFRDLLTIQWELSPA